MATLYDYFSVADSAPRWIVQDEWRADDGGAWLAAWNEGADWDVRSEAEEEDWDTGVETLWDLLSEAEEDWDKENLLPDAKEEDWDKQILADEEKKKAKIEEKKIKEAEEKAKKKLERRGDGAG